MRTSEKEEEKKCFVLAQFICYADVCWIRKIYYVNGKSGNVKINESKFQEERKEIHSILMNEIARIDPCV